MKNPLYAFIPILLISMVFSCTNDDNELEKIFTDIEGTVQGTVSCNTEERGLAFGITPDNFNISSGFIISATLPDGFKQEGLRIKFDMKPSEKYITICTANFFPEQFYEVFNVRILKLALP